MNEGVNIQQDSVRMPVKAYKIGNTWYYDMDADDVKDAFKTTSHWNKLVAEIGEMTTRKENLQKQAILFGGYFVAFMLISVVILAANNYWNRVIEMKGTGKRRSIKVRYITYTLLIVSTFTFDLMAMMFNSFSYPYALFGVGAFTLYNVVDIIVKANSKQGMDDSRLEKIARNAAKKITGTDFLTDEQTYNDYNNYKEEDET